MARSRNLANQANGIDGVPVGGVTPAAGVFTTLRANGGSIDLVRAATFKLEAPATGTGRTLTLPDQTATLATVPDVAAAAAAVESMVLLGTLTTGAQTLSGLTLTNYKQLFLDFNAVSHNGGAGTTVLIGSGVVHTSVTNSDLVYGGVWISLWTGLAMPILTRNTLPAVSSGQLAATGYSNATNSVALSFGSGSMDAGAIRVYGIK